jgi:hypothetical protein
MIRLGGSMRRWTGLGALLAVLALLINVAVPHGTMVASASTGPALVICTGHGPMVLPGHDGKPANKGKTVSHDGACAFAGHGLASAPPPLPRIARADFAPLQPGRYAAADLAPGRVLAAPPPPSHAPPVLS